MDCYSARPDNLDSMCLATFAVKYTCASLTDSTADDETGQDCRNPHIVLKTFHGIHETETEKCCF